MFELSVIQKILPFIYPFNIAFFQTIETTQKFLLDSDGPTSNMVCISDAQTAGRGMIQCFTITFAGRRNRKWESPLGCLMFSIKVPISEGEKHLYELSPHISALAMVLALEAIPQFHVES